MVSRVSKNLLPMIRIANTPAAFEAVARTLPLGNVSFENKTDEEGRKGAGGGEG